MQCFHLQNGSYLVATECDVMPRLRPYQGLWGKGNNVNYFRGTGDPKSKKEGNKGNFGEQGTQKFKILILGNKGKC